MRVSTEELGIKFADVTGDEQFPTVNGYLMMFNNRNELQGRGNMGDLQEYRKVRVSMRAISVLRREQ